MEGLVEPIAMDQTIESWLATVQVVDGVPQWKSLGDLYQFARLLAQAGLAQSGETVPQTFCRLLVGMQLGLQPMQSLVAVSRFGPSLRPSLAYATHRLSVELPGARVEPWYEDGDGERLPGRPYGIKPGDDILAVCRITWEDDVGPREVIESYHLAEATAEGLFPGQPGTWWAKSPAHSLMTRATRWAILRACPQALGLSDGGDDDEPRAAKVIVGTGAATPPDPVHAKADKPAPKITASTLGPMQTFTLAELTESNRRTIVADKPAKAKRKRKPDTFGEPRGEVAADTVASGDIHEAQATLEAVRGVLSFPEFETPY